LQLTGDDNRGQSQQSWMDVGLRRNCGSRESTTFVANAYRDNGNRFVVRADEKLTAFMELEWTIRP
jgi:hypothetical protein